MKSILMIFLLAALPHVLLADTVKLKDGSVLEGEITVQTDSSLSIRTYGGSVFVLKRYNVISAEYGKTYTPRSGVVAVVLSLLYPGIGNFYVGDNIKGLIFAAAGTAGIALSVYGIMKPSKWIFTGDINDIDSEGHHPPGSNEEVTYDNYIYAGSLLYSSASIASCITAYQGSKPPKIGNTKFSLLSFNF